MSYTTEPNDNQLPPKPTGASKAVILLTAIIVVLLFVLGGLAWLYQAERTETTQIQLQLNADKDSLVADLQGIMFEYQELETDNVTLQNKLNEEQERATQLYNELRRVRSVSYAKIKEYQQELGTLRAIMRDMVREIDSLNTLNQQLIAENIKVRQDFNQSQRTVQSLEERTTQLSSTVAMGSVIRVRSIVPTPINRRGSEVTRARRVEKIQTCFVVSENSISAPGKRRVYLRIIGPDGFVLAKSNSDLFEIEGERIVFSASREVDYQNQDVEMCIFFDTEGDMGTGVYQVALYLDGFKVGESSFELR
jgi:hypothetical protein